MNDYEIMLPAAGGIIVLDKPEGFTSHDAVNRLRRLFNTKQVGHTGTLDPLATGVLCLLVGRAVKASEYSLSHKKSYIATMRLGVMTDTGDITGKVIKECDKNIPVSDVINAADSFIGDTEQIPPMYSALKIDGQKLCDIARSGKTVERKPRQINIYSLDIQHLDGNDYKICATVSSGTYIRTLCEDIGAAVGSCATMLTLRRTSGSGFDISDSVTLEQLEAMTFDSRVKLLQPTETLFSEQPSLILEPFFEKLIRNGCAVDLKKLTKSDYNTGTLIKLYSKNSGFFALGKVDIYSDTLSLKADKIFVI